MKRIRWANVAIATVILAMLGYVAVALFGLAPVPGRTSDSTDTVVSDLADTPVVAALPTDIAPPPDATAVPAPTALVLNLAPAPTVAPTAIADDGGFQSEVPVPQSSGNFPL
ncbi:MAG: hypothetical protein JO020_26550, partial [Chloroflexi bacterium]|nr:hypothetical protein [Chloroflexota bacterium]